MASVVECKIFETIQQTIAAFDAKKGYDLANKIYPKPVFTAEDKAISERNITNTEFGQPAIGAISLGYYNVFKNDTISFNELLIK